MNTYTEFLFQIIVCFLLSSCIGIERQYRRRLVGLRTIILVSLGAFLFVRFSYAFPDADMTRIAAQVVAGIGFLGAGVIIKDNKSVKGLTTAATLPRIWLLQDLLTLHYGVQRLLVYYVQQIFCLRLLLEHYLFYLLI